MTTTDNAVENPPAHEPAPRERSFPDPYQMETPEGAEGWEDMYAYHNRFLPTRQAEDSAKTWFRNSLHYPEVSYPFDQVTIDGAFTGTGVTNTRVFALPPAKGLDVRVINGYTYMSTIASPDAEEQARRAEEFGKRAGYYFQNWDSLYAEWEGRVTTAIRAVRDIEVPPLSEFEPIERITVDRGPSQANQLLAAYHRLLEHGDQIWTLHSEFLNLGYAAYLQFLTLCKEHFPEIDDQTISRMVSGVDVLLFRPDDELRALARKAEELGVGELVLAATTEPELLANLADSDAGQTWLTALDESKDPWFYFSYGSGMYHSHRSWIDDLRLPIQAIGDYIHRLRSGDDLTRPIDKLQSERDELVSHYRSLLDAEDLTGFDETLALSRTVFPYVENHNFYIEHWFLTNFWNKVREFSSLFQAWGFWNDVEDIFFLRRAEVEEAIVDLQMAWSAGGNPQGGHHWPPIIKRRKEIYEALSNWNPPPALGPVPGEVNEPLTIMLWGITPETVERWLTAQDGGGSRTQLTGFAGSPGIAEGRARVVLRPDQLDTVQEGEILVSPVTSPSWTPVFGRIRASVSDIGGIMCHAAIVSREYGLPAVVGTGFGTSTIKTGQLIRVDGNAGTVTILDESTGA
ncbi:PEP-utilizing protein mobile subunit [Cryobacterium glaciale]|uniref:PEP-utilizing protein mobile subunit n=1 Tax=Cryobacterium glaciale TaxID=1259145 RepID=A0A4R8UQJ1_9MICO|nr:PEP-utilizing enzyme [Cryobacterium glaciale]TFB69769.1 PEP-utilizing protein mobile subunit [Cryobacterium glaciale]